MEDNNKTLEEKSQAILDRLEVIFKQEGLEVKLSRLEDSTLFLDIKRVAKGAPVMFMVKAIGGTFRRYLPAVQEVRIENFEQAVGNEESASSDTKPLFTFNGLPELDMSGINPKDTVTVLDNFSALVQRHDLHKFRITWKDRVQAATVLPRWARSVNACMHKQGSSDNKYIVHSPAVPLGPEHDPHCGMKEAGDVLPARIMITMPAAKKPEPPKDK